MRDDYRAWLEAEQYSENTRATQMAQLRKIERAYGETLDAIVARGGLPDLIRDLTYSSADERLGKPNPSRLEIGGSLFKGLMSAKSAATLYARFLGAMGDDGPPQGLASAEGAATPEGQRLSLERDLQQALREDIAALEPGLVIIDGGVERAVASGFIDILARDAVGSLVVIELKAGKTDARVIGQVLGYMGDIMDEEEVTALRGIIIAHDFDQRSRSAARAIPNLSLIRYAISFSFHPES
ncbi:endonuclease NucS domain-containing protein [Gemmobacter denitrificans]|uniref:Endonuclease NucS domain-containing protein n=1 Tax=Gemmobacter denitrificans TaxID=3123040 RepID=A0ABU8BWT4_9RHOB